MSRHAALQSDLDVVYYWIERNNMMLNGLKFEHLYIGKSRPYELSLSNFSDLITDCQHVKDLGVRFSRDLKFEYHIINMVKKASNLSNWIVRTFRTRAVDIMLILLETVLRPALI